MRYTGTLPPRCSAGHQFHPGLQNKRWVDMRMLQSRIKRLINFCLLNPLYCTCHRRRRRNGTLSKRRQITCHKQTCLQHTDMIAWRELVSILASSHLVKRRDDGVTREASIGNAELLRENLRSGGDHPLRQQCFKRGLLHPQKCR